MAVLGWLCRFCEGRYTDKYVPTIGIDYGVKKHAVDQRDVRINFFDMAGQPEYLAIRSEFYQDAQGALLVFDPANRASFEALPGWLEEASTHGARALVRPHRLLPGHEARQSHVRLL